MKRMQSDEITAIHPDAWKGPTNWEFVEVDDDTYTDDSWPGCDYRIASGGACRNLAVNIYITGRKSRYVDVSGAFKTRAIIEFVGDGEPSHKMAGFVYSKTDITNRG